MSKVIVNLVNSTILQVSNTVDRCCKAKKRRQVSWLPAVMEAILPNCPFCIMAYSGAMTMCSGNNLYPHAGSYFSWITLLLASLVLAGILLNYRGNRTKWALFFVLLGMLSMIIGQFWILSASYYYLGASLLFFGIWYNGSFLHFFTKVKGFLAL